MRHNFGQFSSTATRGTKLVSDTKAVCWLHISDLHFRKNQEYDRDVVLKSFVDSLPTLTLRAGQPQLLIVSGDVAHAGKKEEYEQATIFFDKLLAKLSLTRRELLVVPGNHDVDRERGRGFIRTLTSNKEADAYFDPSDVLNHVAQRQRAFADWFNSYFHGIRVFPETRHAQARKFC